MTQKSAALEWDCDVALMTHPLMLANFAKLLGVTAVILAALLSGLMVVTGSADEIAPLLGLMGLVLGGIALLFVLIVLVFFRDRMRMHFRVDAVAADALLIDRRARAANKLAIVAGALGGRPNVAGAGLLAEAGRQQRIHWNAVAKVHYHKSCNAIALGNGWRTMVTLYCTAENYAAVAAAVAAALEARPAAATQAKKSPLPRLLLHTLVTTIAAAPLFMLPDLDQHALLPALLVLGFALTALWLIPVLGWVVFAGLGWLAVLEITAQNQTRTAMFDGAQFSGWSVLSGDEQAMLVFAALGTAYLVWQTVGLLRGRLRSGLADDLAEAGD